MHTRHVPREDAPGPFRGRPAVYIGPRGVPPGRSWAVYAADGGAHDRHTLKALVPTEHEAAAIAADLMAARHAERFRATARQVAAQVDHAEVAAGIEAAMWDLLGKEPPR